MKRFAMWTGLLSVPVILTLNGCGGSEHYKPEAAADGKPAGRVWVNDIGDLNGTPPSPDRAASPGAAPTFGTQSGMGLSTGDSLHSSGQGSGMMGYNGVGSKGTSNAISDAHYPGAPDKSAKDPVLPPQ